MRKTRLIMDIVVYMGRIGIRSLDGGIDAAMK
jgi:hypothetical protein